MHYQSLSCRNPCHLLWNFMQWWLPKKHGILEPKISIVCLLRAFTKIKAHFGQQSQLQVQAFQSKDSWHGKKKKRSRGRKGDMEGQSYKFRGCTGNRILFCRLMSKLLNHSIFLRLQFRKCLKCASLIRMLVSGRGKDSCRKEDRLEIWWQ